MSGLRNTMVPFAVLAWLALAAGVGAQEDAVSSFSEAVEVRVVNVETFVTDRAGRPVTGLERDDFLLFVDGEPVEISNFYHQAGGRAAAAPSPEEVAPEADEAAPSTADVEPSAQPFHLAVFVDSSRLEPSHRKRAFSAIRDALDRLPPTAQTAVITFRDTLTFHSGFTADRAQVEAALEEASRVSGRAGNQRFERLQILDQLNRGISGGILGRDNVAPDALSLISRIRAYSADEYHRALQSLRQLERLVVSLAGLPGRKAILYVSDGIPNRAGEELYVEWVNRFGSDNPDADPGVRRYDTNTSYHQQIGNYDILQLVEKLGRRANEAAVTLYSIDATGDHGAELRSALTEQGAISVTLTVVGENFREPLELAAAVTGGRRIAATGLLAEHLERLTSDFDTFYSLGFSPVSWRPGTTHSIEVRVPGRKDLTVRHRETFYVPDADRQAARATTAALLFDSFENPLEVSLQPGEPVARDDGAAILPVTVELPAERLSLLPEGDTFTAQLTFFVSTRDGAGNPGSVQKIPFYLRIPSDRIEAAAAQAARTELPLILRPGDRQVAVTVRDDASGVLSTVRLDVAGLAPKLGR